MSEVMNRIAATEKRWAEREGKRAKEIPTWYVVVPIGGGMGGELLGVYSEEEEALDQCEEWVRQHICDHLKHNLPIKVTEEVARHFDIRMFKTTGEVTLPFQKWADEYYDQIRKDREEEGRKLKEIQEIFAKYGISEEDQRELVENAWVISR